MRHRAAWRGGLIAVVVASVLPMIWYGAHARIEYDGWWHVFIARDDVWAFLARQIYQNTHPPLYFLLLKPVSLLGTEPLVYRSVSILAAGVAVAAVAFATRRVTSSPLMALLCAAAFGLATSTAIIANEVRSYMLATALLLSSLPAYLTLIRPGGTHRHRVTFAALSTLAFLSHYGMLFVIVAMSITPAILYAVFPQGRSKWNEALRRRWWADLLTFAPPLLTIAVAYRWHITSLPARMPHLPEYYFSGDEPLSSFVARSMVQEVELFVPFALGARHPFLQISTVVCALAVPVLLVWVSRLQNRPLQAVLPCVLLTLGALQLGAAVVGKYPFGGALRHQFFLFPFAVMSLFLLLDRGIAAIRVDRLRRSAIGASALALVLVAMSAWSQLRVPRQQLFAADVEVFRRDVMPAEAIYVDGFSLIAFFSHYQEWRWETQSVLARGRLRHYELKNGPRRLTVVADLQRWNPPPAADDVWSDLQWAARRTNSRSLAVFHLDQASWQGPRSVEEGRRRASDLVAAAGRRGWLPRRVEQGTHHLFARFGLAGEAGGEEGSLVWTSTEGWLAAEPNPIPVCRGEGVGATTVSWHFPGRNVEIRLTAPDGKLWLVGDSSGSSTTGEWVTDGMRFFARDRERPQVPLASLEVRHADCAGATGEGL